MNIEVAFDFKNQDWWFPPLNRGVRGHFLLHRESEPTAMTFRERIPEDIPSQVLGVDASTGVGYLLEPVQGLPAVKEKIERQGMKLEPARQEFPGVDVDAWLYWFAAGVKAGTVRVVSGTLPAKINYEPPNRLQPPPKRGDARLREIFRKDPGVAAQYMEWDAGKRKQWEQLVGV